MNINIKNTNINLSTEMSDYLNKKILMIDKLIDPNDTSVMCDVEVGKTTNHHRTGDVFRTEINLQKGGKFFRAVAEEETINAAIDKAKDEMMRELKSSKDKRISFVRRGGAKVKNMVKGLWGNRG
jgi:ribosomal subunit interface protein